MSSEYHGHSNNHTGNSFEAYRKRPPSPIEEDVEPIGKKFVDEITNSSDICEFEKSPDDSDSFQTLLEKFSTLGTGEFLSEQCPLCELTFRSKEFASHVYSCVQIKEDEAFAMSLFVSELDDLDREKVCSEGGNCKSTDHNHFVEMWHPNISCPICGEEKSINTMSAHVNICMTKPIEYNEDEDEKNNMNDDNDDILQDEKIDDIDMNAFIKPSDTDRRGSAPSILSPNSDSSLNINDYFEDSNSQSNPKTNTNTSLNKCPIRVDRIRSNPQTSDPFKKIRNPPIEGDFFKNENNASPSSNSNSNSETNTLKNIKTLSRNQLAACAALVIEEKSKGAANQDVPVFDLLRRFKILGLTKENLKKSL